MSILKKIVFPMCLACLLGTTSISATAVDVSQQDDSTVSALSVSVEVESTISTNTVTASQQTAEFTVSSGEGYVEENVDVNIVASPNTAFASAKFVLHYDSDKLQYVNYSLPNGSGLNSENLAQVENTEAGVVYLVLTETSEDIKSANITITFKVKAAGDSELALEISDMYAADDSEIPTPATQAKGKITGIEKAEEPTEPTTTEPEQPTEPTTTETEQPTEPTTTEPVQPTEPTTTETEQPTEPATTESVNPTNPTTTTQPSATTPTNNATTTTKANGNAANTTTKPATTTGNASGAVNTGDTFPAVPLLIALSASAAVAIVTKRSNKEYK